MRRGIVWGVIALALLAVPGVALAAPSPIRGSGTVAGGLTAGTPITVTLRIHHTAGWQHVTDIVLALDLRGNHLDELDYDPTIGALSVLGSSQAPVSLGEHTTLLGRYFRVNAARVSLTAQGDDLRMTMPLTLNSAPPAGARLAFNASAIPLASTGFKSLTPPVKQNAGFSWGTLGLAIAVALFAGGFVGNIVSSRRRPPQRPSIYGSVQRRLAEERAKSS